MTLSLACRTNQVTGFRTFIFVLLTTVLVSGCDLVAENVPVTKHESHDIRFEYPFYWNVDSAELYEGYDLITISSPLGGGIMLSISSPVEEAFTLDEFARDFYEEIAVNNPIFKLTDTPFTPIEEQIGGHLLTGIRVEFTLKILGIETPQRRDYFILHREKDVVYLVVQNDDDDRLLAAEIERIKDSFKFE